MRRIKNAQNSQTIHDDKIIQTALDDFGVDRVSVYLVRLNTSSIRSLLHRCSIDRYRLTPIARLGGVGEGEGVRGSTRLHAHFDIVTFHYWTHRSL